MDLCLRGGRVIDPGRGFDAEADVILEGRRGGAVGHGDRRPGSAATSASSTCAASGWCPGLIDLHAHLREPGQEYKEDIATGHARGGRGRLHRRLRACRTPTPPNDKRAVTELIVRRAREVGAVRVYPIGAITKGLEGETLAEMGEMKDAGIVAVSDDGRPVMNAELMRRALEYARTFDLPVVQHAEDLTCRAGGAMNEGAVSTRAGHPRPAGVRRVGDGRARPRARARSTGARYHVAHISSADSVRAGARGQAARPAGHLRGDAAPPDADRRGLRRLRHATKCNPPLRTAADIGGAARGAGRRHHRRASPPITRRTRRSRRTSSSSRRPSA